MVRPKSTRLLTVRLPDELYDGLAALGICSGKSVGDLLKECAEFRLGLIIAIRAGYYDLSKAFPFGEGLQGHTSSPDVLHDLKGLR